MNKIFKKIAVVGLWHLGEIFSAGFAELGNSVTGFDKDIKVIENLNRGIAPLEEPDLSELIKKNIASGTLRFSQDFSDAREAEIVWFAFDTPVDENDEIDLGVIFQTLEDIVQYLKDGVVVVFSSQLPVGTSEEIKKIIRKKRKDLQFAIAYVPENLQLGRALKSFFEPGRIVIGAENEKTFTLIEDIFASLGAEFLRMNLASAEMSKHALNAFLATSLSFIYDIADLCEKVGADVADVARALRSDPRIGQAAYLDASLGFSGGTLGRDLRVLLKKGNEKGVDLDVIAGVWRKNSLRRSGVIKILSNELGALKGKTIGILGLTYKVGTSTLRRSLALEVAEELKKVGAVIRAADPAAKRDEVESRGIEFFTDAVDMAKNCEALMLLTAWPQFKDLDFEKISSSMKQPKILFDSRNFLKDHEEKIKATGIRYMGLGRGYN